MSGDLLCLLVESGDSQSREQGQLQEIRGQFAEIHTFDFEGLGKDAIEDVSMQRILTSSQNRQLEYCSASVIPPGSRPA